MNEKHWSVVTLLGIVLVGLIIWHPLVYRNGDVCVDVDERASLGPFWHIRTDGPNPHWFYYPTFSFYVFNAVTQSFGNEGILTRTRMVDLLLCAVLAGTSFLLAKELSGSPWAGCAAAAAVMFSPMVADQGSRVLSDILLSTLITLSVICFLRYFRNHRWRDWLLGAALAGLATSTKYPAAFLCVSYVVYEFLRHEASADHQQGLERQLPVWVPVGVGLLIAAALLGLGFVFPKDLLLSVVRQSGNVDSQLDASDLQFLDKLQRLSFQAGITAVIGTIGFGFLSLRLPGLRRVRPYAAGIVMLIFFVMGSPFIVPDWKKFAYDIGCLIKPREEAGLHHQWIPFLKYYLNSESWGSAALALFGIVELWHRKAAVCFPLLFLGIFFLGVATPRWILPRWILPVLPVVFAFAGVGLAALVAKAASRGRLAQVVVLGFWVIVIGAELYPRLHAIAVSAHRTDVFYRAYQQVRALQPTRVYATTSTPHLELQIAGLHVERVPVSQVQTVDAALLRQMPPGTLLLTDGTAGRTANNNLPAGIELIWHDEAGWGQYLFRRL